MPVLLHQLLVHVFQQLAPLERYRRTPQEDEAIKRRRTGEQHPLSDIETGLLLGPAGIGIGIREVEGGAGDEAEKRSDELEGIRGRELGNEVVERVSVSDSELVSRGKFESSATVDPELADLESVFEEETRSDGGVKVSVMGAVGAQIDHFFFGFGEFGF